MTFAVFYFTFFYLFCLSVCMSLCVCVWAMLPDSNIMMMMMMINRLTSIYAVYFNANVTILGHTVRN